MNSTKSVFAAAVAMSLVACGGGIDVRSDYDPGVDFAGYSTFAVMDEAEGGGQMDGFIDQRIKVAIGNVLTARGWTQVDDAGQADAAVGYQFTTDERVSYQTVHSGWGGYGYGYGGGWYGPGWGGGVSTSSTTERRYEVGSLIIAIFDTNSEEMIYVSTGTKTLSGDNLSPEEAQVRVTEAVETILRDFPPSG